MTAAEVIVWLAQYLYLHGGASSKVRANMTAQEVVAVLIDRGVLVVTDASPS